MPLERMRAEHGRPLARAMRDDSDSCALDPVLGSWIARAARSRAHAVVSAAAVIDFETVVIDGAFPCDVRNRLRDAAKVEIAQTDLQGVARAASATL